MRPLLLFWITLRQRPICCCHKNTTSSFLCSSGGLLGNSGQINTRMVEQDMKTFMNSLQVSDWFRFSLVEKRLKKRSGKQEKRETPIIITIIIITSFSLSLFLSLSL